MTEAIKTTTQERDYVPLTRFIHEFDGKEYSAVNCPKVGSKPHPALWCSVCEYYKLDDALLTRCTHPDALPHKSSEVIS